MNLDIENVASSEEDRGFLDFIADINDDTNKLTKEINHMQDGLNEMAQQIEYGTIEINKISKLLALGNTSFIRNVTRKVGKGIQEFSNKMKVHNSEIANIWERMENNFLNLIDNNYMANEPNKLGLIESVKGLYNMKKEIIISNKKLEEMIAIFSSIKGVERKLTQSVNSLEEQMKIYLSIMNAANSSIDRIINKSELLIGKINFEESVTKQ